MTDKRKLTEEISACMKLLDRAIDIHQIHISNPKTTTPESQDEMMGLMLGTRNCTISQLRLFKKEIEHLHI